MKITNFLMLLTTLMIGLTSCGGSKKAATTAEPSAISGIEQQVTGIDGDASLVEKTADVKVPEKAKISTFTDANGTIQKITKVSTTAAGEKTSNYFFVDNNLVFSRHTEKNGLKEKGKTIFTEKKYFFGDNKLLSAMMKETKVSTKDLANADMKIAKSKFKEFVPTINVLRDEMGIIKKLKQTVK
ncbi:MAG TPA: hypothetical protein PK006_06660 [Saprospiraceae bacterium]|nr:hypothetical protein [Saprospiraceae bacterium]